MYPLIAVITDSGSFRTPVVLSPIVRGLFSMSFNERTTSWIEYVFKRCDEKQAHDQCRKKRQ